MWRTALSFAALLTCCVAQWGTFYSYLDGKIYLLLKNNDLVSLNFSITGFKDLSQYSSLTTQEVNIQSGQLLLTLSLPPSNSSLFMYKDTLYAFMPLEVSNDDSDVCGAGILRLIKYDANADSWESGADEIVFTGINDHSFYSSATYLVPADSSSIYIYGGKCDTTGDSSDRLISFNMDSKTFANISTSTKPQSFYGASNLWAPNPQNQLVVGGKSLLGWINMKQLATWNFQSGWLFELVNINGTSNISSRTDPLVLPVFEVLPDNSTETFVNEYSVSSILVMGGNSTDTPDPEFAKISLGSNNWYWESLDTGLNISTIMGAASIFNTLVIVNKDLEITKRDGTSSYTVDLYDISDSFSSVSDLKSNTKVAGSSTKSGKSVITKAVIGTLVPLCTLSILGVVGFVLWRRRKNHAVDEADQGPFDFDYQLGHFRTILDQQNTLLKPEPLNIYHLTNDSASTLDDASIDSWVRKRQEFDAKRLRTLKRNSYLASNETLGEIMDDQDPDEMTQILDVLQLPGRTHQLRQSYSFTNTPPQLPQVKRKSRLDPGYIDLAELDNTPENIDDESDDSLDELMDVQVLVSSKRKSILRIVNPDLASEEKESLRQRVPSK